MELKKENFILMTKICKAGLSESDINTFTVTITCHEKNHSLALVRIITKKLSHFSHLILQEFLAAIYLIFGLKPKTFKETLFGKNKIDLNGSNFEIVTKFLFGLCSKRVVAILQTIDGNDFSSSDKHAQLLKKFLRSAVSQANSKKIKFTSFCVPIMFQNSGESSEDKVVEANFKSVLDIPSWLYELSDQELTKEIANSFSDVLTMKKNLYPNNVQPICYLLRARTDTLVLDIGTSLYPIQFFSNALNLFFEEFDAIMIKSPQIKVRILLKFS